MKRWLDKSLKRKLSLLLVVAAVLPLLATGVVSYRIASLVTEEKGKESGLNTLGQIADKLDFVVNDAENMSIFIIGQKDIQTYLSYQAADVNLFTQNIGFLTNLAFSKKYISNITITSASGYPPLSSTTILRSGLPEVLAQNKEAYESGPKWWSPLYENMTTEGLKRVISLVRPIRNMNNFQTIGTLAISIDEAEIRSYLTSAGWENKGYLLLVDRDGSILSGGNSDWSGRPVSRYLPNIPLPEEGRGTFAYKLNSEQETIFYYALPSLHWKLIGVIPTDIYKAQNKYVLTVTAVAIGIALLFTVALVLFFIQRVTRPLTVLAETMKDINPEGAFPTYEVKSTDEVGLLLHSFNRLYDRIGRLMDQVQKNEAMKKEADILALQAQINPHFLYNTLSSIHWIALMNKDKLISEMVGALSDFLRFSLNKGEDFCSVQQEIAHAQNYAYIMSMRFQEKFDIAFYVDPQLLPLPMLKLLLQPLIENSIMHGIQKKKEKAHIYVHGERQKGAMKFVVEDTGVGIERDKLLDLMSKLRGEEGAKPEPGKSGYGLRNVHHRLLLHYGSETGLRIESEPGAGTRISFTIPITEGTP
ncbi:histidine kinase [Gordoniibacillus kamchatkensis]|uniref:histidine kinase n=1 Tax=Gordoniibacillus kamchatkensis TaxID=1590651 RepID=A0ABR5AIQ8_9BACL|nr:sensor histidine kinase [Paenibacillus sp. VKM B-2647]KIL40948.1 histidine kinase [Paenibacillus sp. VKM B-2647]